MYDHINREIEQVIMSENIENIKTVYDIKMEEYKNIKHLLTYRNQISMMKSIVLEYIKSDLRRLICVSSHCANVTYHRNIFSENREDKFRARYILLVQNMKDTSIFFRQSIEKIHSSIELDYGEIMEFQRHVNTNIEILRRTLNKK